MSVKASHVHQPGGLDALYAFLRRTRFELRSLRKVKVWDDHFHVIDVNGDYFEVLGIGYRAEDVRPALDAIAASYNPEALSETPPGECLEFITSRRHPWAQDRVM